MKSYSRMHTTVCTIMALVYATILMFSQSVYSIEQVLISEESPPQLIELYTSEGCSSCPSADRWLTGFKEEPKLWIDVVPVAFHVDYWNDLGWHDRFSSPQYSDRQRELNRSGAISQVYTPGVVIDGSEWRGIFGNRQLPPLKKKSAGKLVVTINADKAIVQYHPKNRDNIKRWSAHFALLGSGLQTEVKAGENRNKRLQHDFVVFDKQQQQNESGQWEFNVSLAQEPKRMAVAVWVTATGENIPLQVVGGWIK